MDNQELINEIENWQTILSSNHFNAQIIELAFFKIFVKFEKLLTTSFIHYAIGKRSILNFKPKRKLGFKNIKHLENILTSPYSTFIDYPKILVKKAENIFDDNQNPFDVLFSDAKFADNYRKMQIIRNHIAHESPESFVKFYNKVLNSYGIREQISVSDFLNKPMKNGNSYYSFYITIIRDYSKILLDPMPYIS